MNKKILIFTGDPNSINSEIIYKGWKKISSVLKKKIYFISNYNLIKAQFKKLNYKANFEIVENINKSTLNNNIKILNIDLKFKNPFKVDEKNNKKFLKKSLDYAHKLSQTKDISGFITCPINKKLLGNEKIGLTEYLARKNKVKRHSEAMIITNNKFSVCPITTHIDLKDVSKKISRKSIIEKIKTINAWYNRSRGKKPKICILGLNPHNAEYRKNSEEKKIIMPVVKYLKKKAIKISGPLSADTVFIENYKKYDVVIGMYHDQVIAPFKTIFKLNAINITLGLKYLRVSPDHGTAPNLIMKKKASEQSLIKCINFVSKFSK